MQSVRIWTHGYYKKKQKGKSHGSAHISDEALLYKGKFLRQKSRDIVNRNSPRSLRWRAVRHRPVPTHSPPIPCSLHYYIGKKVEDFGMGRGYSKIRKVIIKAKNNFKIREECNSRIREGAVICSCHITDRWSWAILFFLFLSFSGLPWD